MPKTQPNLYAFPGLDALATALRSYIIDSQNAGFARHDAFKVAVSGGSLPKTLAAALLLPDGRAHDGVDFGRWEVFFADERAVPLDHADSNYGLLKSELLDKIPPGQPQPVVRPLSIPNDDDDAANNNTATTTATTTTTAARLDKLDIQELADAYEQTLVSSFASRDAVRLPVFDLVLLGCGPDGHTCSLFPGHPLLRESAAWVAGIADSPKPPPRRITLTLPVVTHAVRLAFVATGAAKKDVLARIFDATTDDALLPCALVNDGAGDRCSWFVDEPAVDGVAFPRRAFL